MARRGGWLILGLVLGCGGTDGGDPGGGDAGLGVGVDAGPGGPSGPTVEIGTGSTGFVPIVEGETLPLEVGPQGGGRFDGYHIFAAMRVVGFAPNRILGTFQILDADGNVQAEQARRFPRLQPDGDGFVAFAVAPRLMDCCLVEDQPVTLRVEVVDENGLTGRDERRIQAGAMCENPDSPGNSVCN